MSRKPVSRNQAIKIGTYPKTCTCCSIPVGPEHWFWMSDSRYLAGGVWRCRQRKHSANKRFREKRDKQPRLRKEFLEYQREYAENHRIRGRYVAYRSIDRRKGRTGTLKWKDAERLMTSPCFYCDTPQSGGLDRKNSNLGHSLKNVLPCCEKCNIILKDIPFKAKLLLKDGLKEIAESNLLKHWIIPTKRKRR